jgi:hypothetical protein
MTCIEISDLTTAGSKSLAGADSFLKEIGKTETTQIFGGGYDKGWSYWKKDDDCYSYKEEKCDDSYKEEKYDYSYKEEKYDYDYYCCWKKDC